MDNLFIGEKVLIRTINAGVHYGTLVERNDKIVLLSNAKRIWSWSGAFSLNEIAMVGLDKNGSKISMPIDSIILTEAIEILLINKNSNIYES